MRAALGVLACLSLGACLNFDKLIDDCDAGLGPCARDGGATGGGSASGGGGGATGGGGGATGGGGGASGAGECADDTAATLQTQSGATTFCFNGFVWENPLPHGVDLTGVWGASPNDVWAVGVKGMLMHWDGARWTSHQGRVRNEAGGGLATISAIAGSPDSGVWLAGEDVRPHWLDGAAWVPLAVGGGWNIDSIAFSPDGTKGPFSVATDGTTFGPDWMQLSGPPSEAPTNVGTIAVQNDGGCAFSGSSNRCLVWSCDGTELWNRDSTLEGPLWVERGEYVTATAFSATGVVEVWVVDGGAGQLRSTQTFTQGFQLFAASFMPSRDAGFLAGNDLTITDAWARNPTTLGAGYVYPFRSVWGSEDGGSWAVGDRGTTYRQDGGAWGRSGSGFGEDLWGLWVDDAGVFFGGGNGAIITRNGGSITVGTDTVRDLARLGAGWLVAQDNGDLFQTNPSRLVYDGTETLNSLLVEADHAWAVGMVNTILHRVDGGWVPQVPPRGADWWEVVRVGTKFVFVGSGGEVALYESLDAGWSAETVLAGPVLYGAWVPPGSESVWMVGRGLTILSFNTRTSTFDDLSPQGNDLPDLYDVSGAAPDDIWAVGAFGVAMHFDGMNWTRIETGIRAQLERVRTNTTPDGGREVIMVGAQGTVLRRRY